MGWGQYSSTCPGLHRFSCLCVCEDSDSDDEESPSVSNQPRQCDTKYRLPSDLCLSINVGEGKVFANVPVRDVRTMCSFLFTLIKCVHCFSSLCGLYVICLHLWRSATLLSFYCVS